jgi:uncharacterized membrane protein
MVPPLDALQVVPTPLASSHSPHLLVRLIHVLAVALLVGGAVMTWLAVVRAEDRRSVRTALDVAAAYEWLFWGAAGLVVMTGVGNLGTLAPRVPGPGTAWGGTFAVKLLVVIALLAFSAARTVLVRLVASRADAAWEATRPLGPTYAVTAIVLVVVLALAEVLAHG